LINLYAGVGGKELAEKIWHWVKDQIKERIRILSNALPKSPIT
jgi:hypothetical protein